MYHRDSSLPLGGSLGKEPPNFVMCMLIQSDVKGVVMAGGSLSLDMLKVEPDCGG